MPLISPRDQWTNYRYVQPGMMGDDEELELIARVQNRKKPLASIACIVDTPWQTEVKERLKTSGLGVHVTPGRGDIIVYMFFLECARLRDFWDGTKVLRTWRLAGLDPTEEAYQDMALGLGKPMRRLARNMSNFALPIVGLCYGYPLVTTIRLTKNETVLLGRKSQKARLRWSEGLKQF